MIRNEILGSVDADDARRDKRVWKIADVHLAPRSLKIFLEEALLDVLDCLLGSILALDFEEKREFNFPGIV